MGQRQLKMWSCVSNLEFLADGTSHAISYKSLFILYLMMWLKALMVRLDLDATAGDSSCLISLHVPHHFIPTCVLMGT